MRRLGKTLLLLSAMIAALVPTRPATGAFPGANGLIAFTGAGARSSDICVVGADGADAVRLIDGPRVQREPAWSPDGAKIAYVEGRAEASVIKVFDLASGTETELGAGFRPTWSPDGTRIAFMYGGIFVMDSDDGGNRVQVVQGGLRPVWSPDGSTIAFDDDFRNHIADDGGIFLVDANGSNEREISGGEYPDWSPDGTRIVANSGYWAGALFTMNADGSDQQILVEGNAAGGPVFYDPVWAPAGDRIAYSRVDIDATTHTSDWDVWTVAAGGSDARLLYGTRYVEKEPDWQPVEAGSPTFTGDTPCVPFPYKRAISLRLTSDLVAEGVVRSLDHHPRCHRTVSVEIRRKKRAGYRVWQGNTDKDGRFRIPLEDHRPGTYRAVAAATAAGCATARSSRVRHFH